jgi:hypothetical protein
MDILKKTINLLSKEEIINYKLYAKRTQSNENRKDIILFDYIKKQVANDDLDEKIVRKLYPSASNKNNYYRLKNRLLIEINNSLVQFYCYDKNSHDIYSELSLFKIFFHKNDYSLANYHLSKAEKKTIEIQDFSLLDLIYTEQINLSIQFGESSPVFYIKKREQNLIKLNEIRTLDNSLATIIYDLKRSQNFSKTRNHRTNILKKAIDSLNSRKEYANNLVFKTKLFNAISKLLLSQQDYESLEKYVISTYNEFLINHYFSKNNHEIKLQMLAYLCNALFINKKNELSLKYIDELHYAMKEFKNLHYDKYVFFYYNSLVNNYSVISPEKSISVLNEAMTNRVIIRHPEHLGYIYLNLAGAYFDLKQHKIALKNIIKLYNHKLFNTIDDSFKIKVKITEIILRIETNDNEYALKLIEKIDKTYKANVNFKDFSEDANFVSLLAILIKKYNFDNTKHTKMIVNQFCNKNYIRTNSSIVNYDEWLKEKFKLTA